MNEALELSGLQEKWDITLIKGVGILPFSLNVPIVVKV